VSRELDDGARIAAQIPRLRLLLVHLAGPAIRAHADADDLAQEVALRALTTSSGLPPAEPGELALMRLLARIARHTVADAARAIRARKRSGRVEPLVRSSWSRVGARESEIRARTAGPATRAAASEEAARLERAFERLAPEHRRVIALRRIEGLPAAEAARRMGRSESAVHSLYRRALEAWDESARPTSRISRDESPAGPRRDDA